MTEWKIRREVEYPYQNYSWFPPEAIVLCVGYYGNRTIDLAKNLWWGYETELGEIGEGVIMKAKRLDTPK